MKTPIFWFSCGWLGAVCCASLATTAQAAGGVMVWGNPYAGQTNVPPDVDNVVAAAAGERHVVALQANGRVVAWGDNEEGQTDIPGDLNSPSAEVVAIASGSHHCMALRQAGTVAAWGYNGQGQATVPADLTNVIAIAAGPHHSLALKGDGTVVSWGSEAYNVYRVPPGLSDIVAIAAGRYHSLALKREGAVVAWAEDWPGHADIPAGVSNVVAMSCGGDHALALVGDGAPVITAPLLSRTALGGRAIGLYTEAVGEWPLQYQWQKDGSEIPGATNALLVLATAGRRDAGGYALVVSNALGWVTTGPAALVIRTSQRLHLAPRWGGGMWDLYFGDMDGGALTLGDAASFEVQASSNLLQWSTLTTSLVLTNGLLRHQEPHNPAGPRRFYRVLERF